MRKSISLFLSVCMTVMLAACGINNESSSALGDSSVSGSDNESEVLEETDGGDETNSDPSGDDDVIKASDLPEDDEIETEIETETETETEYSEASLENQEENIMVITVNGTELTAVMEDNSSVTALMELLSDGPITIAMSDYANMEKVGNIGTSLPRNDKQINTEAGDLILYQGNSFVIYYDTNSWSLTRLGKIQNITQNELKELLGDGDVEITLSLPAQS